MNSPSAGGASLSVGDAGGVCRPAGRSAPGEATAKSELITYTQSAAVSGTESVAARRELPNAPRWP